MNDQNTGYTTGRARGQIWAGGAILAGLSIAGGIMLAAGVNPLVVIAALIPVSAIGAVMLMNGLSRGQQREVTTRLDAIEAGQQEAAEEARRLRPLVDLVTRHEQRLDAHDGRLDAHDAHLGEHDAIIAELTARPYLTEKRLSEIVGEAYATGYADALRHRAAAGSLGSRDGNPPKI